MRFDWSDALNVTITARVEPDAVSGCSALLAQSVDDAVVKMLTAARVTLNVRYALAFEGREAPPRTLAAPEPSAGGWVRRGLASMDTAHDLRITLADGGASLRLASTPGPGAAQNSPELTLTLSAEGSVLALLPEDLRHPITQMRQLRIRWNLDHESGQVFVNDQLIQRIAPTARPPGPTVVTAAECGAAVTGQAQSLYFVEAGDGGEALNPDQMHAVFHALDEASAGAGALVSVFVHGWQHSAAPGDSYVCRYSELISAVEAMENYAAQASGRPPRRVLGVYVGWPGKLYPDSIANSMTTFWNRLQTADRLGAERALLRQVIQGLAQRMTATSREQRADRRSALIIAGHSMGGRAVFDAFRDELLESPDSAQDTPKAGIVLLVNPAFSAELYRKIHEQELKCRPIGVPLLSFSSEVDGVTRKVYPVGQTVTFPYASPRAAPFLEHIYTAANFPDFVTHHLGMTLLRGDPPRPDGEQTILRGFQRAPAGSNELYSDNPVTVYYQPRSGYPRADDAWYRMQLDSVRSKQTDCPAGGSKVIEVDQRIIPDHGTIFTPPFMEYVVRALNRSALGP